MFSPDQLIQITQLATAAQTILVIFPESATLDQVAAALALHQGLLQLGKQSQLLSPTQINPNFSNLITPDSVATQLGNKDLHVIFDYSAEKVDKVSYHIDEERQKFLLVVQPQKGQTPLDPSSVQFELAGAEADLIFLIGVRDFEQLDQLYAGYEQLYKDVTTISLNSYASTIGTVNLDSSGSAALSEAIMPLLEQMGVAVQDDLATNLLSGIETSTDGFKSMTTSATTFEAVAKLMRNGARRLKRTVDQPVVKATGTEMFSQKLKKEDPKLSSMNQPPKVKKNKKDNGKPVLTSPGSLDYHPGGFNK